MSVINPATRRRDSAAPQRPSPPIAESPVEGARQYRDRDVPLGREPPAVALTPSRCGAKVSRCWSRGATGREAIRVQYLVLPGSGAADAPPYNVIRAVVR